MIQQEYQLPVSLEHWQGRHCTFRNVTKKSIYDRKLTLPTLVKVIEDSKSKQPIINQLSSNSNQKKLNALLGLQLIAE